MVVRKLLFFFFACLSYSISEKEPSTLNLKFQSVYNLLCNLPHRYAKTCNFLKEKTRCGRDEYLNNDRFSEFENITSSFVPLFHKMSVEMILNLPGLLETSRSYCVERTFLLLYIAIGRDIL
jgi:hypothetical protein